MEPLPEQTSSQQEQVARRPPPGRVERVTEQTKGLAEDLRSWVELKLRLTQIEIEDKVETRLNRVVVGVMIGIVAALAGFFALVTISLALGAWLNHPAWGFLITTGLLILTALILHLLRPRLVRIRAERIGIKAAPPSPPDGTTSSS